MARNHHRQDPHEYYLDTLVSRIREIDEDPREIDWIMREGLWFRENLEKISMPDIIACYRNKDFLVAELKGSRKQRSKARSQIDSGVRFIEANFQPNQIYKKFVVYEHGTYYWEMLR